MYKLKNKYIDKMIINKLSSCEIDFLLYVARYQSESGIVESVYYRDVCEKINISVQKFYDVLHNLQEKGLISYSKFNPSDITVTLVGNSFSNVDFHSENVPGYINVAQNRFQEEQFLNMKAGSKLLYLYSQRFLNGKHMLLENFYDEFCRLFQVVKKTLQCYIHELKERKYLFISLKRNRAYHYEMTFRRSTVLYEKGIIPNENSLYTDNIGNLLERNFKKYLPDPDERGFRRVIVDISNLVMQKRAEDKHDFVSLIVKAVKATIEQQRREGKKNPVLNAALVNKWISAVLNAPEIGAALTI